MIRFALNTNKFNNYAFFCPVSRLHLTLSSPVGFADRVTPAIARALTAQTILDIDGKVDMSTIVTGKDALKERRIAKSEPILAKEIVVKEASVEEIPEVTEEAPAAKAIPEEEVPAAKEETVVKKAPRKKDPAPKVEK